MARIAFPVSLALGAILAAGSVATAGENAQTKIGTSGGRTNASTMTLGGQGTAASAAAAPDTELAWYHGYYRGYRRGFYNGYYGGVGLGGYYGAYYPSVYPYPYTGFYPPVVGFGARFGPFGVGVYGINGTGSDATAPAVSLNLTGSSNPIAQRQSTQATTPPSNNRYDGGPANPIPLPKQDAGVPNGQAEPSLPPNTGLPVSLPKTVPQPKKPYAYKGYGEK